MFTRSTTIRLHQTDAYGIIFFANQLKLCYDVFQDWLVERGLPLPPDRQGVACLPVVVRAESDYTAPVRLGDVLSIAMVVEAVGTTSFILRFTVTNGVGTVVGRVRTVHVMINAKTSEKHLLPESWRHFLRLEIPAV